MQDLFNSKANNPTERPPTRPPPPPQARAGPANVSQSITQVTWQGGILLSLNNIGTMPRVVMTMKGARDDDDGCWEKGKPVRDDLSEPVCSSIGISLSLSLSLAYASYISFLFSSFSRVFSVCVRACACLFVFVEKNGAKSFSKKGGLRCLVLRVGLR